jgi:hypothetical protein
MMGALIVDDSNLDVMEHILLDLGVVEGSRNGCDNLSGGVAQYLRGL